MFHTRGTFLFCFLSLLFSVSFSRHLLHHPLFTPPSLPIPPTQPPSHSPQPQPQPQHHQPKLPFSSISSPSSPSSSSQPNNPFFFPTYSPSPPPPSPSVVATFPANISSLLLPHPTTRHHRPALALALSLSLLSLVLLSAVAAFALHRRSRTSSSFHADDHEDDDKASRQDSLRLFPRNAATSDDTHPKPRGSTGATSSPRTDYLYLGTVASSEPPDSSSSSTTGTLTAPPYRKLGDSPELKPLPPLPRHNLRPWLSKEEEDKKEKHKEYEDEEEDEEFFSPRGSSGNKQQSPPYPVPVLGIGDSSPRSLEKLGCKSFTSRIPSHSHSCSPLSPESTKSLPPPHQNPVSASHSPSSFCSSPSSPPKPREEFISSWDALTPPPPPPPPPPRFWETPVMNTLAPNESEETPKPKLKALHWDKVKASSDRATVWDRLRPSSFQLNEDMIETLFMVNNSKENSGDNNNARRGQVVHSSLVPPENRVLDPKKSQNIAILLRALNVTIDEVCEALREGNCDTLGTELLESLLKMAPTKEEETKLREYQDESPFKLGPAEKFLKIMLDIPFAFKRVEAMLYIANFDSELEYLKKSFETLEVACEELRNSRMFLKLLEAVLRTGNRMNVGTNRGDAHAFKLDTLLKLVDIKGTDGKTTLLHFVVQEIIRTEGSHISDSNNQQASENNQEYTLQDEVEFRKLGLQVVSGLSGELTNVKKTATMDSDMLSSDVAKLARGIEKVVEVVKLNEASPLKDTSQKFSEAMKCFLEKGGEEILRIQNQEKKALSSVKEITEYFHGNSANEEAHPFRIFMVVRDFLSILDGVCKEVGKANERTLVGSRQSVMPANPVMPAIFPIITGKQPYDSCESD